MSATVDPSSHSGMASTASSTAVTMERFRPKRSEQRPKNRPPAIAPTMETIVMTEVACTLKCRWTRRNVGYMSWVPWEMKFIMAIRAIR